MTKLTGPSTAHTAHIFTRNREHNHHNFATNWHAQTCQRYHIEDSLGGIYVLYVLAYVFWIATYRMEAAHETKQVKV